MPAFQTLTLPPALYQGDSYLVWNAEQPALSAASERVAFGVMPGASGQSCSIEIVFSGAPGVFEIDFQTSDTDVATDFVQKTIINGVNANNVVRVEIVGFAANFGRLLLVALANAVTVVAKITAK